MGNTTSCTSARQNSRSSSNSTSPHRSSQTPADICSSFSPHSTIIKKNTHRPTSTEVGNHPSQSWQACVFSLTTRSAFNRLELEDPIYQTTRQLRFEVLHMCGQSGPYRSQVTELWYQLGTLLGDISGGYSVPSTKLEQSVLEKRLNELQDQWNHQLQNLLQAGIPVPLSEARRLAGECPVYGQLLDLIQNIQNTSKGLELNDLTLPFTEAVNNRMKNGKRKLLAELTKDALALQRDINQAYEASLSPAQDQEERWTTRLNQLQNKLHVANNQFKDSKASILVQHAYHIEQKSHREQEQNKNFTANLQHITSQLRSLEERARKLQDQMALDISDPECSQFENELKELYVQLAELNIEREELFRTYAVLIPNISASS